MSKRAAIYARTSYDDRDNDAHNLEGQLKDGREYARGKGYQIIGEFSEGEKGASGAAIDLPQLTKLREMAHAHLYDVLIVREVDRLSRDVGKFAVIEKELRHNGVSLEFILYDFPNTPAGRLAKHQLSAIAEYIRDDITERTKRGRYFTVKGGYVIVMNGAPYGYRQYRETKDGKQTHLKLSIFPEEADIVRNIYQWFAHDLLSIHEIVRRLDAIGAPKPKFASRPRKKGWPRGTVFRILRNKTYIGEWIYKYDKSNSTYYGNQEISVQVPAIIEPSLWESAQQIMDRNKERRVRTTKHEYLFRRRLSCGKCGKYMYSEPQYEKEKLYLYYVCPGPNNDRRNYCPGMRIRQDLIDAIAWTLLTEILKDPTKLEENIQVYQSRVTRQSAPILEQINKIDELLVEIRGKLERLIDLYMDGLYQKEELKVRKAELEKRLNFLEKQRSELSSSIHGEVLKQDEVDGLKAFAAEISTRLDKATFQQKLQLFSMLRVEGSLMQENEGKVLNLRCILKPDADKFMFNNIAIG